MLHCPKNFEFLVEDLQFIPYSTTHNLVEMKERIVFVCVPDFVTLHAMFL